MWFLFALIALLMWSGSDLFSKLGCVDAEAKEAPLKMVVAVGLIMGLHAIYSITAGGIVLTSDDIVRYLPISALYIFSMAIGYFGLRHIELSISSPICNASGAVVMLVYILRGKEIEPLTYIPLFLMIFGVIYLGYVEYTEDPASRAKRQAEGIRSYEQSFWAIFLPVLYMFIDAAGTYFDSIVLETMDEDVANTAYELTFLIVGFLVFMYLSLRGEFKFEKKEDGFKLLGAGFETVGQFFYVFALAANPAYAAPMISAYCVVSVLWSRIFLKEKLSLRHYIAILATVVGIVVMGVLNPD